MGYMFGRLTAKRLNAKCDRLSAPITGRASRESQIEAKSRREITRIVAKGKGRGEGERERGRGSRRIGIFIVESSLKFVYGDRGFLLALRLKVSWKLNNASSIGVIYDSRGKIIGTLIYS